MPSVVLRMGQAMVKVTVGKAEDPWCEIDLTEEDVEDGCKCNLPQDWKRRCALFLVSAQFA